MRPWRTALVALAVVVVILGAVYARVLVMARSSLVRAERSLEDGRMDDALFHFSRAAHAYAPLNPWNDRAHDRLWQIGRKAELGGDVDRALQAYRAIRSSILAARSFYTPHHERLDEANDRIARLMARQTPPAADRMRSESKRMLEHMELLRDAPQPDPLWSVLMLVGLAAWISACACFIVFGLTRELAVRRAPALASAAAFLAGLALWLAGMYLA
jgi:hypothetical protein